MNKFAKAILTAGLILSGSMASANQTIIQWDDPKGFKDIDGGTEHEGRFTKRVMKQMDKFLTKLGEKLPEGSTWLIQVNDIDLAGQVTNHYWQGHEALRVMDTYFNPSITITYRVKDKNGKVVAGDNAFLLTDHYVKRYPSDRFMQRPLSYEKYMIKAWFNKVLLPFVEND